jgi:hypothetical protein
MSLRTKLREQITQRLIPELKRRGFDGPGSITGNHPLHVLKRRREGATQVLTIQFEKHGRPRFVLDLCIEPENGFEHVYKHGGTIPIGRATPRGGALFSRSWFRADPPLLKRLMGLKSREVEAVSEALAMLDELEAWWANPRPTTHIADISFRSSHRESAA